MRILNHIALCILLLAGISTFCYAQKATYDSNSSTVKAALRGNELFDAADYENAISAYREYITEIVNNPLMAKSDFDYAYVLTRMGICARHLKLYNLSIEYLLQADSIYTKIIPLVDAFKCQLSKQLTLSTIMQHDMISAEQWGKKTLIQCRRYHKNMSLPTANAHYNLYLVYNIMGDLAQAAIHLQQYVDICKRIGDFDTNDVSEIKNLITLGFLYNQLNKCTEGVNMLTEADSLLTTIHPYHPYRLGIYNQLFALYCAGNDSTSAELCIEQACLLADSIDDSTEEAQAILVNHYNNIAIYLETEHPELALSLMEKVVKHYEENGNTKSTNYALALANYALLGKNDSADRITLLHQATDIIAQCENVDVTLVIQLFTAYITELAIYKRKYTIEMVQSVDILQNYLSKRLDQSFSFLTEGERMQYWNQVRGWYQQSLPALTCAVSTPDMLTACYNGLLQSRGILLSSTISIEQLVYSSGDPVLKGLLTQMRTLQKQQNAILSQAVQELEQRILRTLPQYGSFMNMLTITSDSVRQHLKPGDMAIEFLKIEPNDNINADRVSKYVALVLKDDYAAPHLVELCSSAALESDSDHDLYYRKIWDPLAEELIGVKRIFFSPDGQLFSLPIEYSILPSGLSIIDKYACYRVSSTRELVRKKPLIGVDAVLYGGISYDMTVEEMVADAEKYRAVRGDNVRERGSRGALSGILQLPGTLTETNQIARVINMNDHIKAVTYTGIEATEASFKALSSQHKRIVHIATHGFFDADDDKAINIVEQSGNIFAEDAALASSGLLFAGVDNVRFQEMIPDGVEDGVVDAGEISHIDLHGTEIVVLSACQTAQGIITGDGVFGLQRGFKKAGAQSILMSLWKVDDEATCLLMTEFYRNWIGEKMTKHDALEAAKQTVRSHKEKGWDDPKYWAAFILLDGLD